MGIVVGVRLTGLQRVKHCRMQHDCVGLWIPAWLLCKGVGVVVDALQADEQSSDTRAMAPGSESSEGGGSLKVAPLVP